MTGVKRSQSGAELDLFIYVLLLGTTTMAFAFFHVSNERLGLLAVLWGVVLIVRLKGLRDFSQRLKNAGHYDYSEYNPAMSLPLRILNQLSHEQYMQRGMMALRALRLPGMFWIAFALAFAAWGAAMTLFPSIPDPVPAMKNNLDAVVREITGENMKSYAVGLLIAARRLCVLFIIGASFWLGQSYAYRTPARPLRILCALLLAASFLVNFANESFTTLLLIDLRKIGPYGFGWESMELLQSMNLAPQPLTPVSQRALELGWIGLFLFYAPWGLCAFSLLRACWKEYERAAYAVRGLLVLSVLLFSDLFLAAGDQMIALWVSGWAAFAPYWIRAHRHTKRK